VQAPFTPASRPVAPGQAAAAGPRRSPPAGVPPSSSVFEGLRGPPGRGPPRQPPPSGGSGGRRQPSLLAGEPLAVAAVPAARGAARRRIPTPPPPPEESDEEMEGDGAAALDEPVRLATVPWSEELGAASPECAICLATFVVGEAVCALPCIHVFHEDCIGKWVARFASRRQRHMDEGAARCPLCRRGVEGGEAAAPESHFAGGVAAPSED